MEPIVHRDPGDEDEHVDKKSWYSWLDPESRGYVDEEPMQHDLNSEDLHG